MPNWLFHELYVKQLRKVETGENDNIAEAVEEVVESLEGGI